MLGNEVKKKHSGVGTGLRCSEALARAFGLDWDKKLIAKLEGLGWPPLMIKRYVDDINALLRSPHCSETWHKIQRKGQQT